MAVRTSDRGSTSIKYRVTGSQHCEYVLPQLHAKCFEKQLVSRHELNIIAQNEMSLKSLNYLSKRFWTG